MNNYLKYKVIYNKVNADNEIMFFALRDNIAIEQIIDFIENINDISEYNIYIYNRLNGTWDLFSDLGIKLTPLNLADIKNKIITLRPYVFKESELLEV